MSVSSNVLALLVALISVGTVFVSTIKSGTESSSIQLVVNDKPTGSFDLTGEGGGGESAHATGYYVYVVRPVIMNTGEKPGAVSEVSVVTEFDGIAVRGTLELPPPEASLKAGDYRVSELRIPVDTSMHKKLPTEFDWKYDEPTPSVEIKVAAATVTFHVISNRGVARSEQFKFRPFNVTIDPTTSTFKPTSQ